MKPLITEFQRITSPTPPANDRDAPQSVWVALQGGGALGAYGAGAMIAILENDLVKITEASGTSAGAGNLYLANQKDKQRAIKSIESYWKDIGNVGDAIQFYSLINPVGSYLYNRWKLASLNLTEGPLDYLNNRLKKLKKPHHTGDIKTHINTVVKKDENGDLDLDNLVEHIHSDHVEAVTASGGLSALGGWQMDGKRHWDGAYGGNNPPLQCFDKTKPAPLIVISVDSVGPKTSPHDPHIHYGRIHEDVAEIKESGHPVYHVALADRGPVNDQQRMYPTASSVKSLMDQGYDDALACLKKIAQDYNLDQSPQGTHSFDEPDYRAA